MEIKIDRFSSSSSEIEVVHTKHVFTLHVQVMAAEALHAAGSTSRLAMTAICTLCSRLPCVNYRPDRSPEHCAGGIGGRSTNTRALLLPRPSVAVSRSYVLSSMMAEVRTSLTGAAR